MSVRTVTGIVGNPRPESRTHRLSRALVAGFVAAAGPDAIAGEVDLAVLGSRAFDRTDPGTAAALDQVGAAEGAREMWAAGKFDKTT